jgi:hypothetical protein
MADTTPTQAPDGAKEQAAQVASAAKDQAGSVAASAKEQAASVASTAVDEARAVAGQAASEARDVLADARYQLRTQADEQATKVASLVGDIGGQLRTMADAGQSGPARDLVASVADQAQQLSRRLQDGGLDRSLEDARRFARNRPGMFLAGAALAGFVAARLLRAADTDSLKQAATSSGGSNGHGAGQGALGQPAAALPVGGAPAPRPLVADPLPHEARPAMPVTATEAPR